MIQIQRSSPSGFYHNGIEPTLSSIALRWNYLIASVTFNLKPPTKSPAVRTVYVFCTRAGFSCSFSYSLSLFLSIYLYPQAPNGFKAHVIIHLSRSSGVLRHRGFAGTNKKKKRSKQVSGPVHSTSLGGQQCAQFHCQVYDKAASPPRASTHRMQRPIRCACDIWHWAEACAAPVPGTGFCVFRTLLRGRYVHR